MILAAARAQAMFDVADAAALSSTAAAHAPASAN